MKNILPKIFLYTIPVFLASCSNTIPIVKGGKFTMDDGMFYYCNDKLKVGFEFYGADTLDVTAFLRKRRTEIDAEDMEALKLLDVNLKKSKIIIVLDNSYYMYKLKQLRVRKIVFMSKKANLSKYDSIYDRSVSYWYKQTTHNAKLYSIGTFKHRKKYYSILGVNYNSNEILQAPPANTVANDVQAVLFNTLMRLNSGKYECDVDDD